MIKSNTAQFNLDLAKLMKKAKDNGVRVVKATVFELQNKAIDGTPVDTGAARNRWSLGLNVIDDAAYGGDASGGQAKARNIGRMGQFTPGDTIWLTNNLPYIRALEYGLLGKPPGSANGPKTAGGFSTQALGGWVRIAHKDIQTELPAIVRAAIK